MGWIGRLFGSIARSSPELPHSNPVADYMHALAQRSANGGVLVMMEEAELFGRKPAMIVDFWEHGRRNLERVRGPLETVKRHLENEDLLFAFGETADGYRFLPTGLGLVGTIEELQAAMDEAERQVPMKLLLVRSWAERHGFTILEAKKSGKSVYFEEPESTLGEDAELNIA